MQAYLALCNVTEVINPPDAVRLAEESLAANGGARSAAAAVANFALGQALLLLGRREAMPRAAACLIAALQAARCGIGAVASAAGESGEGCTAGPLECSTAEEITAAAAAERRLDALGVTAACPQAAPEQRAQLLPFNTASVLLPLGQCLALAGRPKEAERVFRRFVASAPPRSEAAAAGYGALGQLLGREAGREQEAAQALAEGAACCGDGANRRRCLAALAALRERDAAPGECFAAAARARREQSRSAAQQAAAGDRAGPQHRSRQPPPCPEQQQAASAAVIAAK